MLVICVHRPTDIYNVFMNTTVSSSAGYEMRLSQGSYTVAEGGGQVVVCVELVRHSLPASTAVVILSTSDGKATGVHCFSYCHTQLGETSCDYSASKLNYFSSLSLCCVQTPQLEQTTVQ